ncbi:bifunctional pyrazinamidase/nicotinamidase [Marinobacterium zhoushanense]|uniref:nicotinamidase n=1 Tax=Marinobacterium zhoushanense TaxID=1679163 RepID=A0ABQ1KUH7_9GAMM|nr:isochorismatase family protein [Marinobacterium zhoushanense]GGC08221.1 bifunctional pyrazinamidase/nicotinamidase [Marinobacterium zhoushanense]
MYTTDGLHLDNTDALRLNHRDALLLVDLQRDFLPGGALGVADGDQVIPVVSDLIALFKARKRPILATRDWHPPKHCSFQPQGGPWPPHCIQQTPGSGWAPGLNLPPSTLIVSKGTAISPDAYSGFQGTDLAQQLSELNCQRLFVAGLATDYCVLQTVLDARKLGFEVQVVEDAIRAVNVNPGDGIRALDQILDSGAELITLQDLIDANP